MGDYKIFLGYGAIVVGIIGYIPYLYGIFKNKVRPHAFSWLVWGTTIGIVFFIQLEEKGGAGSWVTGISSLICFAIFILASLKNRQKFPLFDWMSLFSALFVLLLWWKTNNSILSIVLITVADTMGFLPTFRKAFLKPFEEVAITFILNAVKYSIAIIALENLSLASWLYPATVVFTNSAFVSMLFLRRRQLKIL